MTCLKGSLKPAGILGFGPGTVRRYDELARRTGRGLPSPDSYFTILTQRVVRTIGHRRLFRIRFRLVMLQPRFISALKVLCLGS
jgi:hypothetical protein